jgi:hypothetical protein
VSPFPYRYALVLQSGEPADPAIFATAVPDWRAGDEFVVGAEAHRFRIVTIDPVIDLDEERDAVNGVWVVEPVPK